MDYCSFHTKPETYMLYETLKWHIMQINSTVKNSLVYFFSKGRIYWHLVATFQNAMSWMKWQKKDKHLNQLNSITDKTYFCRNYSSNFYLWPNYLQILLQNVRIHHGLFLGVHQCWQALFDNVCNRQAGREVMKYLWRLRCKNKNKLVPEDNSNRLQGDSPLKKTLRMLLSQTL